MNADLLVIGAGVAGLYAALCAAEAGLHVTVVCAGPRLGGSTRWAQGGVAAPLGAWDRASYAADTLAAGRGLCCPEAVQVFTSEAQAHVERLSALGLSFAADLALEGGHSRPRVRHAYGDATGLAVSETLHAAVNAAGVTVLEGAKVQRLLLASPEMGGRVVGAALSRGENICAGATLLAAGGYSRLYPVGTAPVANAGRGLVLAALAGAVVRDPEFVQFHPTAAVVAAGTGPQALLISEAVRGAGGVLRNGRGERFMAALDPQAELAPRDVVARAIAAEWAATGRVTLDISHLGRAEVERAFPSITARLAAAGLDLAGGPVEVQPAAHYSVGGVKTDLSGWTGVPGLYAAGEVASVGLHGANRLASNSLSEGLVFGARAAQAAAAEVGGPDRPRPAVPVLAGPALTTSGSWEAWQPHFAAGAGLVRSEEGLRRALAGAPAVLWAGASAGGPADPAADADAAATLLAVGVLQAALRRGETRGTHARTDCPQASPHAEHTELRLCRGSPGEPVRWEVSAVSLGPQVQRPSDPLPAPPCPPLPRAPFPSPLFLTPSSDLFHFAYPPPSCGQGAPDMTLSFPDLDTRLHLALAEDLGRGDATTQATVPPQASGRAEFLLKSPGVPSGYAAAARVFALLAPALRVAWHTEEGQPYPAGTVLGAVEGPLHGLLAGERLALNLLQRQSGVATRTRQYVDALAGSRARLLDTRKTNPLWRDLDKQAVRHGGACNHRAGLDDGILIKDNHIAAVGSVAEAVRRARDHAYLLKVECEVTAPAEVQDALSAGADRILLDNMTLEQLRECVQIRDREAPHVTLEASGNVTLDTLPAIAASGVDFISSGALTHSAPALDISLNLTGGPS